MNENVVCEQKKQLYETIDSMAGQLTQMADFIFDHPETDGNEVQAAALLTGFLKDNGFSVEMDCGGLKTAFRCVYQNRPQETGGAETSGRIPRIGILCEYDGKSGTWLRAPYAGTVLPGRGSCSKRGFKERSL